MRVGVGRRWLGWPSRAPGRLRRRPAAAFMAFTMGVAFFGFHAGDPFRARELAFLFGVVALGFLVDGSGRFGLDALLARRRGGADVLSGGGR